MADLKKGFENVRHEVIEINAKIYDLSPKTLRLALSMYIAERRIRCGSAYSKVVKTVIGLIDGCPIAMGLLLLNVSQP